MTTAPTKATIAALLADIAENHVLRTDRDNELADWCTDCEWSPDPSHRDHDWWILEDHTAHVCQLQAEAIHNLLTQTTPEPTHG